MNVKYPETLARMQAGNARYLAARTNPGDVSPARRLDTAQNGQHPYAIVIACADSRVVPESIFSAGLGDLFVIRVAGNVIGDTQLGSIQYAAGHLGVKTVVVLGHTNCGAVGAAMAGGAGGYVGFLTGEIAKAIGAEQDDFRASAKNVGYGVSRIREALKDDRECPSDSLDILGAVYHIDTGTVDWLN